MENDQNHEAIHETHEAIMTLQAQIESIRACQLPGDKSGLYQREGHAEDYMIVRYERGGTLPATTTYKRELEEVRNNFEAYRKEMDVETVKLREEVLQYQREPCRLGMVLANANARIEFLNGVYSLCVLNGSSSPFGSEQHRMAQEHHAAEELASADIRTERLRNNCSNLGAEKKIWEVENTSRARESLVKAETNWKHLQERVDELVKQAQTNEEKIAVRERRTSSATLTNGDTSCPLASEDCTEQELKAEVAELQYFCMHWSLTFLAPRRAATKAADVDVDFSR
ncbi:hypothetical protein A7U60_g491 [Sanghuangporus baumii]|uniref:Uncharacterized protein n=1 Tax=Sanghuangporus baumii TaxID=108892 RepID=A0A9Q5I5N8_SANBA|nr:hypothetical protein A7U60_g491 [Sanghuangporus baumii]